MALPSGYRLRLLGTTGLLNTGGTGVSAEGEAVKTWQDQSGNGYDLVQGTAGREPFYQLPGFMSNVGRPGVRFELVDAEAAANRRFMNLHASHSTDRQAFTYFEVSHFMFAVTQPQVLISPGAAGVHGTFYWVHPAAGSGTFQGRVQTASGAVGTFPSGRAYIGSQRAVYGLRGGTSNVRFYKNREYYDLGAPLTAGVEDTGGLFRNLTGHTWHAIGTVYEVVQYPSELSDANVELAIAALMNDHGIATPVGNIVCDGDSIMAGHNIAGAATFAVQNMNVSMQMANALQDHEVYNVAVSGQTIGNLASNRSVFVDLRFNPNVVRNFYCVHVGTNDTAAGTAPATTYAAVAAHCSGLRAAGWKVIVTTQLPRGDGQTTNRNTYNGLIRAGYQNFADGLVDLAADPLLDDNTDTTYYDSDQIHLNTAGCSVMAQGFTREVERINRSIPFFPRGRGR